MSDQGVTLVDYGLGNIQAFAHIYRRLGVAVQIASDAQTLRLADRIVLPGVGSFDWAISRLNASGLRDTLDELVLGRKTPVLGVCVGMQMMAERSEEGKETGLRWIAGDVVRLPSTSRDIRLPHMGWNDATPTGPNNMLEGIKAPRFYFLHSYILRPINPDVVLSWSEYGTKFASAIGCQNVFGTQFHPEKSHNHGVDLLRNFCRI